MTITEPDEEESILDKMDEVKNKIDLINDDLYDLSMQKKFLNHRLADLNYQLNHPDDK